LAPGSGIRDGTNQDPELKNYVRVKIFQFFDADLGSGMEKIRIHNTKKTFLGLSDQVKCFYCDGGLRNWQPEDDPWVEHARYPPKKLENTASNFP
jgi:hypothetical protein